MTFPAEYACDETARLLQNKLMHAYEVRPRKDLRDDDRISDVLPFGRLWYGEPDAISYAKFYSRSHRAMICVFDGIGNATGTHEQLRIK